MNFKSFIKDKILLCFLLLFGIATIEIFLIPYPFGNFIKIYIPVAIIFIYIIGLSIEYFMKQRFYKDLEDTLNNLDDKYLISELIKVPSFIEGKILKDLLEQINKSMVENVNKYKYKQEDYKEYIELWIHEIKIPIASSKLIIENNKNQTTKSIDEELQKIENYIEQALYYARSNTVEKDYCITKSSLKEIINLSVMKNKSGLLSNKINIKLNDLEKIVYTDSKWAVFIINQIIQNCIKYSKIENKEINIFSKDEQEKVILYIRDNGIGIIEGELNRVFDKGFTGTNGRIQNKKSTGIGLYLCKKLCSKLGIGIELDSKKDIGTEVKITFPKNSYTDF